jgi:hypothetical protein
VLDRPLSFHDVTAPAYSRTAPPARSGPPVRWRSTDRRQQGTADSGRLPRRHRCGRKPRSERSGSARSPGWARVTTEWDRVPSNRCAAAHQGHGGSRLWRMRIPRDPLLAQVPARRALPRQVRRRDGRERRQPPKLLSRAKWRPGREAAKSALGHRAGCRRSRDSLLPVATVAEMRPGQRKRGRYHGNVPCGVSEVRPRCVQVCTNAAYMVAVTSQWQ